MVKVLIVEDEKLTADRLQKLVEEHAGLEVTHTCYSVKSAINWFQDHTPPDLVFMDIQLGDGTGFDILESIDSYPYIIFTTAFDQYTLDAFRYNSIDYLLKPVKPEDLVRALDKFHKLEKKPNLEPLLETFRNQMEKRYRQKFLIKLGLRYQSVRTEDIAYFFSKESSSYLVNGEGQHFLMDQSLDEIQSSLDPQRFFRVNRHVILHTDHIESIESYFNNRLILTLAPSFEEKVIVSREKVRDFKRWLNE